MPFNYTPDRPTVLFGRQSTTLDLLAGKGIFPVKKNAKTPLTEHGFKDASSDPAQIDQWEEEFPGCNWGMPTGQNAGVVVLDLDAKHPESLEWWREQQDIHGTVDTLQVSTPSGGTHCYFQAPQDIPLKSTASQIAPGIDTRANGGYIVIPPSVTDGNTYEIVNDVDIAEIPAWLLNVWPKVGAQVKRECSPVEESRIRSSDLLNSPLPDGQRNNGLTSVAGYLWNRVATLQDLEIELLAANARLCCPPLPTEEVLAIAQSISRYPKDSTRLKEADDTLSWEEIQAAVAHIYTTAAEPYYKQGTAGPRRRFISPIDRATIRNTRQRIGKIWASTEDSMGNQAILERAERCGNLPRQTCNDCGTGFSSSKNERHWCRARLHPICMGVQMRQPLWDVQALLEEEARLQIGIVQLGFFDIGEDPFLWADQIKEKSQQAHNWIRRLTDPKRKIHLESMVNSFIGYRFDLHDGYLTIDLVILSSDVANDAEYLCSYFSKATKQAVEIGTYDVSSAAEAIDVFGNVMSCAVIYDDTYGCRAFLEGLKHQHMVQGRGRFRGKKEAKAKAEDKKNSANISNPSEVDILETNVEDPEASGNHCATECPECGSTNVSYCGREPGDWRMVTSKTTGNPYWRLFDAPPEQRRETI